MKRFIPVLLLIVFASHAFSMEEEKKDLEGKEKQKLIFAVFAETKEQREHAAILAESIRTFAGVFKNVPIWIYVPESLKESDSEALEKIRSMKVAVKTSTAPTDSLSFYFSRKVFAAAQAEKEAASRAEILAWMDEDTLVIREPLHFLLKKGKSLGYRPVMHKNVGSLYAAPPDPLWGLMYQKLSIPDSAVFPMVTPADSLTIRPYFNAGLLVVRPERGLLQRWAKAYPTLYRDPGFKEMCNKDQLKKVFLHQVALSGAVLCHLKKEEILEFPPCYNYPLFFHEKFQADKKFTSLEGIITVRYDVYFRNPTRGWRRNLKGPMKVKEWIGERF